MLTRRFLPSLILILLLVLVIHIYNQWSDLGQLFFVRRTVAALGLAILLFGPAVLLRRGRYWYLIIVSLLVSILLILHFLYASYAGGFFSVSALKYSWQVRSLSSSVQSLIGPQLLFFLTPVIAAIILWALRPRGTAQLTRRARRLTIVTIILAPLLSAGYILAGEYREQGNIRGVIDRPFNSDQIVRRIGVLNYSVVDTVKYAFRKKSLTAAEQAWVRDHSGSHRFQVTGTAHFGSQKNRNIIYIQLESFQQFVIGRQVNGQPLTPHLNRLAAESVQFTNFHYMVGPGTSSDAEFTVLNSLIYPGDSAAFFEYPANTYHALPSTLAQAGYTTAAYHGDDPNFWNRHTAYPALGYQQFHGIDEYHMTEPGQPWGLTDRDFFDQTPAKLARLKSPYFAHLITLTSHLPFKVPPKDQGLNLSGLQLTEVQRNYLQSVHYTDAMLGQFIEALRASGQLDQTLLVVTGDHEPFITSMADTNFAQFLGYAQGFDDLTYLQARQVPLLIRGPGLSPQQVTLPGSHLDIYPALTNLLGLPTPPTVLGRDLLNTTEPLASRRRRGGGIDLEMALSTGLSYVGSAKSSNFTDGTCYDGSARVAIDRCRSVYQRAHDRVQLSDLLVTGNALDLLK